MFAAARHRSSLSVTSVRRSRDAAAILAGGAEVQYWYVLLPEVTIDEAATGRATLVALIGGSLVLVPALLCLYALVQRSPTSREADDSVRLAGAGG